MADRNDIFHRNVPGRFYVDNSCIDCGQCPDTAPEFFWRDDEEGVSYVHRQPTGPEEIRLATEALEGCPTESIGDDGVTISRTEIAKPVT